MELPDFSSWDRYQAQLTFCDALPHGLVQLHVYASEAANSETYTVQIYSVTIFISGILLFKYTVDLE